MNTIESRKHTCCFTGHRNIATEKIKKIEKLTAREICKLVTSYDVHVFCVGGAIGYDTLVAKVLLGIKETMFPNIEVILIYPFDGFTEGWKPEQQEEYKMLLPKYDKVICACDTPRREAYLQRDRLLVDSATFCIAYCTRNYGGTAYTIRYAKQQGLTIQNIAEKNQFVKIAR